MENQLNKKVKVFNTDGGGEFLNDDSRLFCESKGIIHKVAPAYTPQLNGIAERANRTVLEKMRCLLLQSNLSAGMWGEALSYATTLSNLTPTKSNSQFVSPSEIV